MSFSRRILISNFAKEGYQKFWEYENVKNEMITDTNKKVSFLIKGKKESFESSFYETDDYNNRLKTSYSDTMQWFTGKEKKLEKGDVVYEKIVTDVSDVEFNFIYCPCGYEGEAEWIGEKKNKEIYGDKNFLPKFVCPNCQQEPKYTFAKWMHEEEAIVEYVDLIDNRNQNDKRPTVALSWATTKYYYNQKSGRLAAKNEQFRIITNVETGMTYLFTPNRKRRIHNITHGFVSIKSIWKELQYLINKTTKKQRKTIKEFLEMVMELRGIQYKTLKEISGISSEGTVSVAGIFQTFPYFRYPQLQHISSYNWTMMPQRLRKRLRESEPKATSIFQALIGIGTKGIRLLEEEYNCLNELIFWSLYVKKQDNLIKIVKAFNIDETINSYENLFSHTFYGKHGMEAMKFVRSLYKDENVFVNSIIKLEDHGYLDELLRFIKDIKEMHENICSHIKDYKIKFHNDIERLHDDLTKDFNRIKDEKREIKYKQKELLTYEKNIDEYEFVLAKNNHELIKVGTDMHICVGSYSNRAIERKTTIVFMKQNENVEICIEIQPLNKQMKIVQAKAYRNQRPNHEQTVAIRKWCKKAGISTINCYDLTQSEKAEEMELIG